MMSSEGSLMGNKDTDCLSCRLVRGFGCLGIGSYLIYEGRHMKSYNRRALFIFGACFGIVGMASLVGMNALKRIKFN